MFVEKKSKMLFSVSGTRQLCLFKSSFMSHPRFNGIYTISVSKAFPLKKHQRSNDSH